MGQDPHNLISEKKRTQEKILEFLRRNKDYLSGEDISRHLDISRQALWQHINDLRGEGYDIVAVPHLGYRMESLPDRLFPFEVEDGLATKFIGRRIYYLDRCTSTMDIAIQLAGDNPAEGTLVISESQTKGKGRLGRHWVSPKYKGIYLTLILKPKVSPGESAVLTLLAAVSVCEALKVSSAITASIKWPNDILINNKKFGGILTEIEAELDRVHFVFIGIGLNVNNEAQELLRGAVSLRSASHSQQKFNRAEILREILRKIEENYIIFQKKGSPAILDKWKALNITLGKRVKISCGKEHTEGVAVGIDIDGGLLVRADSGKVRKFMSGDVTHLR
jgi:BirA family biotin operon repressor/biotin-[acetyl-CoA-carboxylase] ligase